MTYKIEEVLTKKGDPLHPRMVFRIVKKGRRLMETNSLERGENPSKYKWVDYEEYLMSDYLTERAAQKALISRQIKDVTRINHCTSPGQDIHWESSVDQNS